MVFRLHGIYSSGSMYPEFMLPNRRGADGELTPEGKVGEELRAVLLQGGDSSKDMEWMFRIDD